MADSVKIKITGDDKEFQSTLSGIGQKAGSIFKGMMASQIVTKGISLLNSGLKSAINTGLQFEAAMSQVAAISGATGQELELLTETAKRYGETTMFSASQAANALNYMALAGWDAQQSVDALGGVLDLAAASGMDLGAASDAVTDYLSAFSMEASRAGYMADLMAWAQSKSNTTAAMLADAYGNCASSMHAAGQDIETTTAMLMALANQGIKGSEAGTQLAAVMRDLTQKMDNGQIMIGKTAVKVTDAAGNFRDLNDIIMDVGKATEGMGTAEQSAAIMTTFTARSVKAVQTLLNEGVQNVNEYEEALRGSEGTAAEQASTMMDNLQGDIKIFKSALEGVQITASETMNSTARSIVQEGTSILEAVNQAGKTGGIGGMFDAVIAQIPSLLPKVTKGIQSLLSGLGKRLPGLVKNLIATLPDLLGSMGELVPSLTDALFEGAAQAVESLIGMLPQLAPKLVDGVLRLGESVINGAANVIRKGVNALFGITEHEYESFGPINAELIYDVDTDADIDLAGAEAAATQAWMDFVGELNGYGLTTEQVAQLLAFTGTTEELDLYLDSHFPNLDDAARNAIKAKFTPLNDGKTLADVFGEGEKAGLSAEDIAGIIVNTDCTEAAIEEYLTANFPNLDDAARNAITKAVAGENGTGLGSRLVSELSDLGIRPKDIVAILTAQAEGDTDTVEGLLEAHYAPVKQQAIDALTNAWNSSTASFYTSDAGLSFGAQLIVDMFTNGKEDDPKAVDDALKIAKEKIDEKRKQLIDYINGGGEDQEGARSALSLLDEYDAALTDYASNYANASTAVCEEQGKTLLAMCQQAEDATNKIVEQTERVLSIQERIYNLGTGGAQLSNEDYVMALGWIGATYNQEKEALDKAREEALKTAKTAEDYDRVQQQYDEAMQAIFNHRQAMIADLIRGQTGNDTADLDVGAALYSVWDQIEASFMDRDVIYQDDIEKILRDAGYGDDIIGSALAKIFGSQTYHTRSDAGAQLEGLDIDGEIKYRLSNMLFSSDGITPGIVENILRENGYSDNIVNDAIAALFSPDNMHVESIDFDTILMGMNFDQLGPAVQTAIDSGMIEDVSGGLEINRLILSMLGNSGVDTAGIGADVKAKTEAIGAFVPEGMKEGMSDTSVVEKPGQALGKAAVDSVADGAEVQSPSAATQRTGEFVVQGLAEGLGDTETVAAAGGKLGEAAVNAVKRNAAGTFAAGFQVAAGVARGITAGRSMAVTAAIALAQATVQAMRDVLQIHSPSRVTEGFGRMFDRGLVAGIDKEAGAVVRSAVSLVNNVVGAANLTPKMDLSGVSASMNGAINDLADIESNREWAFYLNGREMARASTRDYNTALNGYGKRISMGYGRG